MAVYSVFDFAFVIWLGILTFFVLLVTAAICCGKSKGIHTVPIRWHFIMARIAVFLP